MLLIRSRHGSIMPHKLADYEDSLAEYYVNEGYVQLTNAVDVDFQELSDDVIIASQIQAIDKIIEKKEGEHYAEMQQLKQRKQELMAITFKDCRYGS